MVLWIGAIVYLYKDYDVSLKVPIKLLMPIKYPREYEKSILGIVVTYCSKWYNGYRE